MELSPPFSNLLVTLYRLSLDHQVGHVGRHYHGGHVPEVGDESARHAVLGVAGVVADRVDHVADDEERLEGGGEQGEVEPVDEHARRHEEHVLQELQGTNFSQILCRIWQDCAQSLN